MQGPACFGPIATDGSAVQSSSKQNNICANEVNLYRFLEPMMCFDFKFH